MFLDRYGNDVTLTLNSYTFESSTILTQFVNGYQASATPSTFTATYVALFQFSNTAMTENVFIYIPFVTGMPLSTNTYTDIVDLTTSGNQLPSNTLQSFSGMGALTPFNFFDNTDFNQWYTAAQNSGGNISTVLISKFVYNINTVSGVSSTASTLTNTFNAIPWNSLIATTGDKLCYASFSTGNVYLH